MIAPETFFILPRGVTGEDSEGNDTYTDATQRKTLGAFAPKGSVVSRQGQFQVLDNDTLYLAEGQPVPDVNDRMRVRGHVYDIDSIPAVWRNPHTGNTPGATVQLRAVTG